MTGSDTTTYRWSRAYGLRIFAIAVMTLAAVWVLAAVLGFPTWALVGLVVVAGVAGIVLLRLVILPPPLLDVSADGYRLRNTRAGGVTAAGWAAVESIASEGSGPGAVMLIRLSDGRTTAVPLSVLGSAAPVAERDIHERLNAAFGYQRLDDQ